MANLKKEPDFVWGDKVKVEHIDWLWPNRIPLSMLSLLVGMGGVSKSTLSLYMAAQITTGRPFIDDPPGTTRESGDVIILSGEDLPGQIIIPRLIAMEANISRICILKGTKQTLPDGTFGFVGIEDLSKSGDLDMLHEVLKAAPNPKLAIIDPYTSYMPGNSDSNDNLKVRSFLRPLGDTAEHFNISVLGITHLNKKEDSSAASRVLGSVGQQNAARMVWLVAQDPDAEDRRYLVWLKGNLAPKHTGLAYRLINTPASAHGQTSYHPACCFEPNPIQLSADELLAPRKTSGGRPRKQTDASDWLESFLSEGPVDSQHIYSEGDVLGYSQRTLERVKKSMGILGIPIRDKVSGKLLHWDWRLPS